MTRRNWWLTALFGGAAAGQKASGPRGSTWEMPKHDGPKPTSRELSGACLKLASMVAAHGDADPAVLLKALSLVWSLPPDRAKVAVLPSIDEKTGEITMIATLEIKP